MNCCDFYEQSVKWWISWLAYLAQEGVTIKNLGMIRFSNWLFKQFYKLMYSEF